MGKDRNAPVALLACANAYQDRVRKQHLIQEKEMIARIFASAQQHTFTRTIKEDPEEGIFLFDQFRQAEAEDKIQILHIAGYSKGEYLHFDGGLGEEAIDADGFSYHLGRLHDLKVVFLNGCATPDLLNQLILRD
ncbi:MAG: hypothetical protein AAF206_23020, partial [Bacteroidota bacterium]